ncbi:hypothetical protein A3D78_03950 [Candidatus Gottesmanbacteria bacterium RIFCSPHIGHO2_02_FULL_39_14]|uniref:ABC transporter permease n=1 Tax=Candidatus Gottesmanbacteria bacterium RIFCSPHIGHO2_02_FULL_39_14 TaxID=1798383 RepID=A0A1F6A1L0_9BACT|nr:MAG: hypothetical protein A3D78_03950 [Candidatus Gottesmanbacteria bacterium RIFCSPHIGHO2_02_FULL_39_14]
MSELTEFKYLIGFAVKDLIKNKTRTFLTSLGILIGISSVVILNSLGLGLKKYIEIQFKSLGSNLVIVMPGKAFSGGNFRPTSMYQMNPVFDEKDIRNIEKNSLTQVVAPAFVKFLEFKGDLSTRTYETVISTENIFTVLNSELDQGLLFNRKDIDKRTKIAVLGSSPAQKLFGSPANSIGKTVKINNQSYKVIGVLKSKGGAGSGIESIDDHVYLPYKGASSFNPDKKFLAIYAKTSNQDNLDKYKDVISNILSKRYAEDDFSVLTQQEILTTFTSIFNIINIVLVAIAAISLIVGGVGIMNIMFVSVVQRIKEIGIRRAYGARERDILLLFLSQTIILSLIGGILGLLLSYLVVLIIQNYFPVYIDLQTVILALSISSAIGLIFGVLPALRAARLTPVEAIRKE